MARIIAGLLVVVAVGSFFAASAVAGSDQVPCRPTLSDGAGPFGSNAIDTPLRSKIGTGHVLVGRVLAAPDCGPVRRAVVYFWQSGPNGYGPRGRARILTDRNGGFRFEGPVPFNYGRGAHIHMAVVHPAYEDLVTRYDVRRGAKTGRVRLVLAPLL
jgi:protocatechuate 3,4-dioxygenase beta subunit